MVQYNLESNLPEESKLVCTFTERLDTVNCAKIDKELFDKVRETKTPVIFNLEEIDYISSMFLAICLRLAKEVGLSNFSIINVRPNVKKVFKIAGFDKQIRIT
jgi:anti-anti-sigma factor